MQVFSNFSTNNCLVSELFLSEENNPYAEKMTSAQQEKRIQNIKV